MERRSFLSISLLLSLLAVLPACQWMKDKMGCQSCGIETAGHKDSNMSGEVLLSINKKPYMTVDSFEDFWGAYIEGNPNASLILSIYPNLRQDMFKNNLVPLKLARAWAEMAGKDKDDSYRKKVKRQLEFMEDALALEALREDVMKNVDKSDSQLMNFYNENRDKTPLFQQPPFLKKHAGVEAVTVEFANEKEAKDFLEKAKKEGANFNALAKEAGKEVKDLGVVTSDSKVEPAIKMRITEMSPNEVIEIEVDKDKFVVAKAISKQAAEYASYDELKNQPEVKEAIEQQYVQAKGGELFQKRIDELKKELNVEENSKYFEKEQEQRQAEMQARIKEMEAEQAKNVSEQTSTEEDKATKAA